MLPSVQGASTRWYNSPNRLHVPPTDPPPQIHDLLARAFWPGIDGQYLAARSTISHQHVTCSVSDSLQYSPTQCTIVSAYKRLVVGAAFLSSPDETYLTYLVCDLVGKTPTLQRAPVPFPQHL